jgi:Glycosyl hydrolase family 76
MRQRLGRSRTVCVYQALNLNSNTSKEEIDMKTTIYAMTRHLRGALASFAALAFVLITTTQASAQWTANDAQRAYTAYNNAFYYLEPDGYSRVFVTEQGGTTHELFWKYAEEIEAAIDAYSENPTSANKTEVQALCDGLVNYVFPATNDMWTSDDYNDDLDVAIIAFARAYEVTGTTRWLTDAENNFTAVWNRAQAGDGGLCENTGGGVGCYENSSVNWTFVIAGHLLTNYSGDSTYATEADGVYNWAIANLYDSATGEIYDGDVSSEHIDYSYNYGFAIGAMSESGAGATMITQVATYLYNDMSNSTYPYAGTYDGYNILPNYHQGDNNDGGFNGIACRWVGIANGHGTISASVIDAQQANTNAAWSERNGTSELIWNDWVSATPSTGTYSWDDSSALACLMDTPPTS